MKTLLIRAENKNRWESRTPIVPEDLAAIIRKTGAEAFVEQSAKRFADEAGYRQAGAVICNDMSPGDVILGIKEIPVEKILPHKTYVFFSHTIKGQQANMALLKKIIDSGSTLIDYEKIVDGDNRRLIYFGPHAGGAGAIDILSLLAETWAHRGIMTPLAGIKRAHQYESLQEAMQHLAEIGRKIRSQGFPAEITPFTVGILGYGNVSKGAQQIFDCLPCERIAADTIIDFVAKGKGARHTIYLTVFQEKDLVRPRAHGAAFELQEYFNHPERYENSFEQYLASFTLLVNAVYWNKQYPRFITWQGLKKQAAAAPAMKLSGIADISCDIEGAVECTVKSTDSDAPAFRVDPVQGTTRDGHLGEGIVLLAVDNLPCELPNDSSSFFSRQLAPFVPSMLSADYTATLEHSCLAPELQAATIVYNGQLTEAYSYLRKHL